MGDRELVTQFRFESVEGRFQKFFAGQEEEERGECVDVHVWVQAREREREEEILTARSNAHLI